MAESVWIVRCECGARVRLEDDIAGECTACGKPVEYKAPAAKPANKKPAGRRPGVGIDIEKNVGTFKFTGK